MIFLDVELVSAHRPYYLRAVDYPLNRLDHFMDKELFSRVCHIELSVRQSVQF